MKNQEPEQKTAAIRKSVVEERCSAIRKPTRRSRNTSAQSPYRHQHPRCRKPPNRIEPTRRKTLQLSSQPAPPRAAQRHHHETTPHRHHNHTQPYTMEASPLFRALLRAPAASLTLHAPTPRPQTRRHFALLAANHTHARYLSVPRVLQPSFWGSMIPKPLRSASPSPSTPPSESSQSPTSTSQSKSKSKPRAWNPATPFVVLGLLVGSQAIQILWLKQERAHSARRAETKIGVLREVLERVQRGEEVDVEGLLGTGDQGREREWAEGEFFCS